MTKHLILVGAVPPPINGQSVAFQILIDALQSQKIPHSVINISSKIANQNINKFNRSLEYLKILTQYVVKILRWNVFIYVTIAQSRQGFVRDFIMIWLASLLRHEIVAQLHGGNYHNFYEQQPKWLQFLIRKTLLRLKKIAVLGESLRSVFDFEPRLASKIFVIPNGIPNPNNAVSFRPKQLPDLKKPISLLYLSNLIESKGYLDVVESVGILVNQYQMNVLCHFCGEFLCNPTDDVLLQSVENAKQVFYEKIHQLNLNEHIKYEGVVDQIRKNDFLKSSDFMILPTQFDCEGQPLSILEAMSHGCVVISTKYRSIPDMVKDGKTGFLVPYQNPSCYCYLSSFFTSRPSKIHTNEPSRICSLSKALHVRNTHCFDV